MARVCDICGKGPQFGNTISHAHNVSKRRWNVNLRPVHAKVGAATKHIRVCTSCLRSGKVVKASLAWRGHSCPRKKPVAEKEAAGILPASPRAT